MSSKQEVAYRPSVTTTFTSGQCLLHVSAFAKNDHEAVKNRWGRWCKCKPL